MRPARARYGLVTCLAIASTIAGAYGGVVSTRRDAHLRAHPAGPHDEDQAMLAEAIENLERQVERLAAHPGPSCPQDFAALETGRTLRVSLFYGYDEHDGWVYDRANAGAMLHVLTRRCRAELSSCGFSVVSRSSSAASLARTLEGRRVEVGLFTSSMPDKAKEGMGLLAAYREEDRLGRSVKDRFQRELVESDIVFYMGHSRLGGGMGFEDQTGVTTLVNSVSRRPLLAVIEALRQRPTKLRILGMFSCGSNRYFRQVFQGANPSLSLILTTGDIRYGPAEQASLGALEAVLSKSCGHAFHESMVSASQPDRTMTYLFRGRQQPVW